MCSLVIIGYLVIAEVVNGLGFGWIKSLLLLPLVMLALAYIFIKKERFNKRTDNSIILLVIAVLVGIMGGTIAAITREGASMMFASLTAIVAFPLAIASLAFFITGIIKNTEIKQKQGYDY